ncbi:carboxypeptidase family protein [Curtobacterium sp. PhB172]|uniref:carboxypeptidase-like regulatory domain-containing protein n=1 Tax=Curtobacterium sp. PhB172 TaxID=2485196 RepID=UPI000FB85287|nr:carboxypeptidase-like regulatory domain-containing protein [Curtobacterium sp. PhB172]ROS70284.1 carboxypeptidase family protein [Curtobacterium sp. PhB172]
MTVRRRRTSVGITTALTLIGVLVAPVTAAVAAPDDGALTVMLTDFDDVIPAERTGVVVSAGRQETVVLVVRRGASIGGTAHNPYGADLSGAAVVVRGWNTGTVRRTVTSPDGHYWVHGLPSDDYSVQVNAHHETLDSWPALRGESWAPTSPGQRSTCTASRSAARSTRT